VCICPPAPLRSHRRSAPSLSLQRQRAPAPPSAARVQKKTGCLALLPLRSSTLLPIPLLATSPAPFQRLARSPRRREEPPSPLLQRKQEKRNKPKIVVHPLARCPPAWGGQRAPLFNCQGLKPPAPGDSGYSTTLAGPPARRPCALLPDGRHAPRAPGGTPPPRARSAAARSIETRPRPVNLSLPPGRTETLRPLLGAPPARSTPAPPARLQEGRRACNGGSPGSRNPSPSPPDTPV
jgi:hypothetical protein